MINLPQENVKKLEVIPDSINYSKISTKINDILQKADNGHEFKAAEFTGYGGQDVRSLLKNVYKKCVYCENTSGEFNVEHYRPKTEVRQFDGDKTTQVKDVNEKEHPGYYWLSFELTNLLWVCALCNKGEGGKHSKFPTEKGFVFKHSTDKNNWKVNSITLLSEQPLLLHPLVDNPEEHLNVNFDGKLQPISSSEKGDMTIKVCNLNRDTLWRDERKKIIDNIFKNIHQQIDALTEIEQKDIEILVNEKGTESLYNYFQKTCFSCIGENKEWSNKFSSVYRAIYDNFKLFLENSKINSIINDSEKVFLTNAFEWYKKKNESV